MSEEQPPTPAAFNQRVIDEFRANNGAVGGRFAGVPLLLLTTAGARTGTPHTNPVVYVRDGDRILIFASNAGGPSNPDWFHNLVADPQVVIEVGEGDLLRTYSARAVPLRGGERDRLYREQAHRDPAFRDYQERTSRTIPVVALHPLRPVDLADPARGRAIGEQLIRHHEALQLHV